MFPKTLYNLEEKYRVGDIMDFTTAMKRPFSDVRKLLIGIVLSLIPIVNWISQGYVVYCSGLSNKVKAKKGELPEWKNWGDLFITGFLVTVIYIIYMIPAMIFFFLGVGTAIVGAIVSFLGITVPAGMVEQMVAGEQTPEAFAAFAQQNWMAAMPGLLAAGPFIVIALVLAIITAYVLPSAALHFVKSYKFADAFQFGNIFKKAFTSNYFIVWILTVIVAAVVGGLLGFLGMIGSAFTSFTVGVFAFTLFGEVFSK